MLEMIRTKLNAIEGDQQTKFNYLREYLQLLILKVIDEKGYFKDIAFVGGTALRILFDLQRYSEDLDFSLMSKQFVFARMLEDIQRNLNSQKLSVAINSREKTNVAAAFVKFKSLLYELGFSAHKDQVLNIKIEVDKNPPEGYHTEITMIKDPFLFAINHYDLPSLFAGKLHAILCRKYEKGRDYYDLLWYLAAKIQPNFFMLEQAILQTEQQDIKIDESKLTEMLITKINSVNFNRIKDDLRPFLPDAEELRFFNKDFFLDLLRPRESKK